MTPQAERDEETDPRPTDPQFQFLMLLCARKSGNQLLESLARNWLAESGIHVVFTDDFDGPSDRRGGRNAA